MSLRLARLMVMGLALSFCAAALRAGDAPPAGGGDEEALDVVYRTGYVAQPPIKVSEDNWLVVKGEHGTFRPEYLATTVEMVDYHDRTPRWNLAMERIRQKNWPKALVNFKKMFDEADPGFAADGPPMAKCAWAPEIGNYYYGYALLRNGQAKLAADKFMASVAAKGDGRYTLLALLGAADAYLQSEQVESAQGALKKFDEQLQAFTKAFGAYKFPGTMTGAALACREYAEDMKLNYLYVQAKVYYQLAMNAIRDGKAVPPDAESACQEYVRKASDLIGKLDRRLDQPETAKNTVLTNQLMQQWRETDAQATQVSNMLVDIRIGMKDFTAASSTCQKAIDDYEKTRDPRQVSRLPAAYAGLGKVAFFEADNLKAKNDPIKAQKMFAQSRWYYQHVMVLYFDNTKYLQDALFYTGLCNEYLAGLNVEKDARERAYDNFKRLAEMMSETDPRYREVVAALERTKPAGGVEAAPVAR